MARYLSVLNVYFCLYWRGSWNWYIFFMLITWRSVKGTSVWYNSADLNNIERVEMSQCASSLWLVCCVAPGEGCVWVLGVMSTLLNLWGLGATVRGSLVTHYCLASPLSPKPSCSVLVTAYRTQGPEVTVTLCRCNAVASRLCLLTFC